MNSIDIVVPCYRYGRYLRECVQSILMQGVADVRVLVIDDESPDDTPQVGAALASEDARVTYRRHAINKGHIATYNEGIEWAEARYMLLLSADDYLLPGALARAIELLDRHPQMSLAFGDAVVLNDSGISTPVRLDLGKAVPATSVVMTGEEFLAACARRGATNFVPTPTAIVRTDLLKRFGGYVASLPHTADLELWLRMAAHGSVGYLRSDQAVYRRHSGNMSLGYLEEHVLRDLEQRREAVETFAANCQSRFADAQHWRARLLHSLAGTAVGRASDAFNRDRMELSQRICDFASSLHPGVRWTWQWNLLLVKRRLGLKVSTALLPAAALARGLARKLRG